MKRKYLMIGIATLGYLLLMSTYVLSLPSKWRLFELKYGYRPSCNACHVDGGGSDNNDYGMDFHHKGENTAAFAAIESKDSDGDGIANIDEIKGKSNPGDPRSTPQKPGKYIQEDAELFVPKRQLSLLFPTADSFTVNMASIDSAETVRLEKELGLKLAEDERVPTFYWAYKEGAATKTLGVGLLFFEMHNHSHLGGAVACDTSGHIKNVVVFKQTVKKGLNLDEFNRQFVGKTYLDRHKVGHDLKPIPDYDTFSQKIADFVKKSAAILNKYALKT